MLIERKLKSNLIGLCLGVFFTLGLVENVHSQEDWRRAWEKTLAAAQKEGQLNFYGNHAYPPIIREFRKKYPRIKVVEVTGTASQIATRLLAERRAGKYLGDVYAASPGSAYRLLIPRKVLDPLPPALILPENVDQSKWFQGKHHYVDPERKYAFVIVGSVRGASVAYNTKLVSPEQINSYRDLLDSKWRGKIASLDPHLGRTSRSGIAFLYHNPDLGPGFIKQLYGEMDITLTRDEVQLVNWLSVGKFSIAFFTSEVKQAEKQGLPVRVFDPSGFKEGAAIGPTGRGGLSLINRAPHPNAAKVFINWLLSREGQVHFQRILQIWGLDSMREDIPKDGVIADARRVRGVKYVPSHLPKYQDTKAALKVVDAALRKGKKKTRK